MTEQSMMKYGEHTLPYWTGTGDGWQIDPIGWTVVVSDPAGTPTLAVSMDVLEMLGRSFLETVEQWMAEQEGEFDGQ